MWSRFFAKDDEGLRRRPIAIQWPAAQKSIEKVSGEASFPRFRTSTLSESAVRAESEALARTRIALRSVFTPAQPVTDRRMFAGRLKVLSRLIEIIEDRLSHVVIFGERGIGKTSLLHILSDLAEESRYVVLHGTCGAGSRFDEMFRRLLESIPLLYLKNISPTGPEVESGATFASQLPSGAFDARELSDLLAQIAGIRVLIILDEYDRLENEQFRQYTAELIKNLSDRAAPVQLVIAGVSSNLHELIGYIPSIRRNVIGLPLPHLTSEETEALVALGNSAAGVTFGTDSVAMIHSLANGSPYVTRLICHHASGIALDGGRTNVVIDDIIASLDRMVEEAEGRLAYAPAQRVRHLEVGDRGAVLGSIARIASTPDGWFTRSDLLLGEGGGAAIEMVEKTLIPASLVELGGTDPEPRYKFIDEGLPNYLWLMVARNQIQAGAIRSAA
ncbi:MAG: ATP-binding protein [Pseudomonadota bacterium]